ncbi:MAG: hypothetical protein KJZ78_26935, partial [Bryobacteraceae bacterium]|nr:hypothetical protein [Bryobacteraceae bacterium]
APLEQPLPNIPVPLRYGESLRLDDVAGVVRIAIPRSELARFGLPVAPEASGRRIQADVLLGVDGVARAMRFVKTETRSVFERKNVMGFSRVSMFIAGALAFCAASVLSGQETIVGQRIGYPPAQAAAVPAEGTAGGVFQMALPPPPFGGEPGTFSLIAGQAGFGMVAVAGAPYSAQAVTETSRVLGDGTRIQQKNTVAMYRDSEGRTRREQTLDGIGPWRSATGTVTVVFIHDPVAKEMYTLNPADKTATMSVM